MKDINLLNGKQIKLSKDELKAAGNFHKSRYAFAWINGKLIFNDKPDDDRPHEEWMQEDYGLTVEEYEKANRGYMLPTHIQLFKGSSFSPIDTREISVSDFTHLCKVHGERYGTAEVEVRNGVKIGKIGEVWPPLLIVGKFSTV